ncbi:MAG: YfhO family protein, partial [Lachnospiraceae bacterium]
MKNLTSLSNDKTSLQKAPAITCLCSVLLTLFILLLSFILMGFAPFGDKALLYKDGQQQMVDLFCWYKDVLTGRSSLDYSFTKYLGGSNFAVFTYYLSSPFSLLIVFFNKSQASLFMNVLYLLKTLFAALFASFYLCRRFKPDTLSRCSVTVILAASYALNAYMISQSSNIMWLDGVYMLPLILAGVEKLVNEKKSTLFIVSAGLGLIFNWYVGIINLMFAGIWLFFETARKAIMESPYENKKGHPVLRSFGVSIARFAVASVSTLL